MMFGEMILLGVLLIASGLMVLAGVMFVIVGIELVRHPLSSVNDGSRPVIFGIILTVMGCIIFSATLWIFGI